MVTNIPFALGDLDPVEGLAHLDFGNAHLHSGRPFPGKTRFRGIRMDFGNQISPKEGRRHLLLPGTN